LQIYGESKDPNELKDYEFDWSAQLADGETVVSQVVSFVDAAGTTNPTNSVSSPYSRVWLAGGTSGQLAVFTILATTSGGRSIEAALGVNILDSVTVPTDIQGLQEDLVAVNAAIRRFMAGEVIKDVSRDGRRIVRDNPTYRNLLDHRDLLKREIQELQNVEEGLPRRSAIGTFYC
jgi:hypothetical protein